MTEEQVAVNKKRPHEGPEVIDEPSTKKTKDDDKAYKKHIVYTLNDTQLAAWFENERQFTDHAYSHIKMAEEQAQDLADESFQIEARATTLRWESFSTFEQMLQENCNFLYGKTGQTFYYGGPVEKEMIPLVPDLVRLHERGFLTIGSQVAENVVCMYRDSKHNCLTWRRFQQRAFVDFFCPHNASYLAVVEKFFAARQQYKVSITRVGYETSSANFGVFLPLNRCKNATKRSLLKSAPWQEDMHMMGIPPGLEDLMDSTVLTKYDGDMGGYMHVSIARMGWDPELYKQTLLQDLLDACDEHKMLPIVAIEK